jgi:hypothetical protein
MAAIAYYSPFIPAFSSNGAPVAGAKLNFYTSGTTTRQPVYTTSALTTELPNPVPADAAGKFPSIYLNDANVYRVILTDAEGVQLGDAMDPYVPGMVYQNFDPADLTVFNAAASSAAASAVTAGAGAATATTKAAEAASSAADADVSADDASSYLATIEAISAAAAAGYNILIEARVASTYTGSLSGLQVLDGIQTIANDRALLFARSNPAENGPWIVASGSWTRPADYNASGVLRGTMISAREGPNAGSWIMVTPGIITIGTTAQQWNRYQARSGISFYQTRSELKNSANTAVGQAILAEGVRAGVFEWNATFAWTNAQYDPLEGWFLFPVNGQNGAWVRCRSEGTYARHAGLVNGTGVSDAVRDANRAAIQAAIDVSIYTSRQSVPQLGDGLIEYRGTIHIGYGDVYHNTRLEGEGPTYAGSLGGCGTSLFHFNTTLGVYNEPAINIQGCRAGAGCRGFYLRGALYTPIMNFAYANLVFIIGNQPGYFIEANWTALGGDARYSPYAGITVDAYCGVRPAGSYPDVTYPAFATPTTQYGKKLSSAPVFENMSVDGFNTLVALKPSNDISNADFPVFRNFQGQFFKWGFSVGNSQCRNFETQNTQLNYGFCALTNSKHGTQNGRFGGAHIDFHVSACSHVLDVASGPVLGSPTFINLYCESTFFLGYFKGSTAADVGFSFINPCLNFTMMYYYGTPAEWFYVEGNSHVLFQGGSINDAPMALYSGGSCVEIRDTYVQNMYAIGVGTIPTYLRTVNNKTGGGILHRGDQAPRKQNTQRYRPCRIDTGAFAPVQHIGDGYPATYWGRNYCLPDDQWTLGAPGIANDLYKNPRSRAMIYPTSIAAASIPTKTRVGIGLTLTFTTLSDQMANHYGRMPGDMVWHSASGTWWVIKSRVTTTIVCEQITNYRLYDNEPWVTIDLNAGQFYFHNARHYSLSYDTSGTGSTASPALTAVKRPDGSFSHLATDLAVGDVTVTPWSTYAFTEANATLTAVDTGAGGVTLGGNCRVTGSVSINDWVRVAVANS